MFVLTNEAEFQKNHDSGIIISNNPNILCIPSSKGFHYIKFRVLVFWNSKVQHLIKPDKKIQNHDKHVLTCLQKNSRLAIKKILKTLYIHSDLETERGTVSLIHVQYFT